MELIYGSYILMVVVSVVLYILPMMIAFHRRHENYTAIFLINLLLGWTGIVWVICLVWSFISRPRPINQDLPDVRFSSKYEQLEKISKLRSSGVLTSDEFEREKARILE